MIIGTRDKEHEYYGIIAIGPGMGGAGTLAHAIVLRALTHGMSPAEDSSNPDKYVVHLMVISEEGKVFFESGNYFECSLEGGARGALKKALKCFSQRMMEKLGFYFEEQ